MPTYRVYKDLRLMVEIEAATAQEAYEEQLNMDNTSFTVIECDYSVFTDENADVSDDVDMR